MTNDTIWMNFQIVKIIDTLLLFLCSTLHVVVEVMWENILSFQNILYRFDIILLVESFGLFLHLTNAHILNFRNYALNLTVDFYEIGDWHARKMLHLDPIL